MHTLKLHSVTAAAFARYGWLASAEPAAGGSRRAINDGTSLRVDGMGTLALDAAGGAPCLAVFRAQPRHPRGPWRVLERHRLGTQTFVPMGGARYVVLVALGDTQPDPSTLAAFEVHGHTAVTLHAGTWHHGLISPDGGDFVVIERVADAEDCELATLAEPLTISA